MLGHIVKVVRSGTKTNDLEGESFSFLRDNKILMFSPALFACTGSKSISGILKQRKLFWTAMNTQRPKTTCAGNTSGMGQFRLKQRSLEGLSRVNCTNHDVGSFKGSKTTSIFVQNCSLPCSPAFFTHPFTSHAYHPFIHHILH